MEIQSNVTLWERQIHLLQRLFHLHYLQNPRQIVYSVESQANAAMSGDFWQFAEIAQGVGSFSYS